MAVRRVGARQLYGDYRVHFELMQAERLVNRYDITCELMFSQVNYSLSRINYATT